MGKVAAHLRILTNTYKPAAAVERAHFIGHDGAQLAVAGAKAEAISQDAWDAADIARAADDYAGNYNGLAGTIYGFDDLVAGAAFADGAELASDGDGAGVTAVAADYVNAIAHKAAGAAGDIVLVRKIEPYKKA